MSLKSVQTYEVDANGILKPVAGLAFQTDGNGSTILGGAFSNISNTDGYGFITVDGTGRWKGFVDDNSSTTIVGGSNNCVIDAMASLIGAGQNNTISGKTLAYYAISSEQPSLYVHGSRSFIGGGTNNSIYTPKSVIVGGHNNTIKGNTLFYSAPFNIPYISQIDTEYSPTQPPIFFGTDKFIKTIVCGPGYNGIIGGKSNCIDAIFSIIGGGFNNKIISEKSSAVYSEYTTPSNLSGQFNFIGAGENLLIRNSCYSAVLGGKNNSIDKGNSSVLVGGCCNLITGIDGRSTFLSRFPSDGNTLVGGCRNAIYGSYHQFIGGGANNFSSGVAGSAILGGYNNCSLSTETFGRDTDSVNVIVGGSFNSISGGQNVIFGGLCNKITSNCCSSIIGGNCNTIASNCASILGGFRNNVSHLGAVLIGDYTSRTKTSAANHTLSLDFASGILLRSEYVPLTHTSNGYSGQIAYDANYHYRHNGTNWTRTAMSIW